MCRPVHGDSEHVAVVAEPGGHYTAHFAPETGRAIDQAQELVRIATANCASIRALGCDGAAVNTGRAGGVCTVQAVRARD